ncbi:Phage tail tape-measure protein, controls tail length [Vreelandella subterranea]|uniref:Phage tail tape-measure protein, controls tail length n=1 Tax=Vreelandella subterranea TaxID=416874 RepID=A0A1H9S2M1_9GAMM|nr:phage tail tape measure protein [Halomonas subterranea]SER78865.1 Phage tail tape-measure protein, controls tail length [Halomonas subterranea]
MSELRASVVMDLRGNLERQSRRYEGAMRTMANNGQRHMTRLQRVTGGVGRQLDRVGNRWVALATGAAGVGVVRNLTGIEERWERLGISIGKNREEMEAWRHELRDIARAEGVRIDSNELTSAVELVAQSIQDVEWARESMEGMAVAIAATGESGDVIGQLALEMHRFGAESQDVVRIFDTLERQQDGQRISIQGMAQVLPEMLGEYSRYGREGTQAITELGAALTTVVEGGMDPSRARRSMRGVMEVIADPEWQQKARSHGIAMEDEAGQARALTDVMREVAEFRRDHNLRLGDMGFSEQAARAFGALTSDEGIRNLNRLMEIQGDGEQITAKSARSSETAAASIRSLGSAWEDFADSNLSGSIQEAADALNSLDQETVDRWLKIAGITAGGVAGLYALRSLGRLGADLGRGAGVLRNRSTSGGVAGGLGAASSMAPVPVFVTNMGALGGGGSPGRTGGTRKGGGYTPPSTRTGGSTSTPTTSQKPRLSSQALSAALKVGTSTGAVVGRSLPAISTVLAAQGIGGLIEDAVERTETGGKVGNYVELARESAKQAVMEYGRNSVDTFRDAGESVLRIFVDQDGRVKDARAERGQGGPEIDVDLGNWRAWQ